MRQKRDGMVGVTFEREYKLGIIRAALAPIGIHLEDHLIFVDGDMLSLKNSEHRRNLSAV